VQVFQSRFAAVVGGTLWLLLCNVGSLPAQQTIQQAAFIQPPTPNVEVNVTPDAIEARRKAAAELADLDEDTKKKVDSLYAQALDNLKKIADAKAQSAQFRLETEDAQQRAQFLKKQAETLQASEPAAPPDAELPELKAELTRRNAMLAELKAELAVAEAETAARDNRKKEILNLQTTATQRRDDLQKQIEAQAPANEPMVLTDARRTELVTRRLYLEEETPLFQSELARNTAETEAKVAVNQLDYSTVKVTLAEKELRLLEQAINVKEREASDEAERQARAEVIAAHPLLQPIAEQNQKLVQIANDLIEPLEATKAGLAKTTARLDEVEKLFADIQHKVDNIGLTGPVGALLRRERIKLPDLYIRRQRVRDRRTVLEDEQFKQFQYDDDRRKLANRDAALSKLLTEATEDASAGTLSKSEQKTLEDAAGDVLDRQVAYLDDLLPRYKDYVDTLYALDQKEQELIRRTEEIEDYIDERVLWIRSNAPIHQSLQIEDADQLLLSPEQWAIVIERLIKDAGEYLSLFGLSLLAAALLIVLRPKMRRELASVGAVARKGTCSTIMPTLRSGWLTVLLSVLWPALVFLVGFRLTTIAGVSVFGRAVGHGLQSLAIVGLSLEFLRNVCRPHGLADDHFDWPDSTIGVFRKALPKLTVLALPIAFLTTTLYHSDEDHGTDFPERACFIFGTIVLSMFLRRTLRPESGVLCEYLSNNRGGWLDRLTSLWYWGGVLSPLVLGGLAAAGFYYTAYQLAWRLFATMLFLVVVQLVRAFLQRMLIVQQRRLRIDQLRQKREEAARAAEDMSVDAPTAGTPLASVPLEELRADVEASTEQSRRLLATALLLASLVGAWTIWVDVLPALRFLDRWPLWTATVKVTEAEEVAQSEGMVPTAVSTAPEQAVLPPREKLEPVTIIHLSVAILIAVLTIAAARNVPGLMELWVLQKLPLDQSIRYAIRALTSYAIVLIGVVFSFKAIYVGWSQVQWLATALTFGLAFGLQEIFANFVAGLILLFERPIRVGDVVTVDDVSGVVSRIRIRATTITNWDRKEYVIPNKEFITGRMLNWTLSDKVNRIVINVGVAYGSDTEQARSLLLQICHEHPLLLDDPPPVVTFEGFGDNTLNLVVRTYLPDLDNRLGTIHELHTRINDEFNRAGIEIAFPQRDLHIRSIDDDAARRLRGETPGD
jgi:potassium efflux system protein